MIDTILPAARGPGRHPLPVEGQGLLLVPASPGEAQGLLLVDVLLPGPLHPSGPAAEFLCPAVFSTEHLTKDMSAVHARDPIVQSDIEILKPQNHGLPSPQRALQKFES